MAEQAEQQEVCRLIRAVQRGEPTAFDDLMACYAPLLKRMIGSFSKTTVLCEAEKEDLKQEAAIALYKAALGFDLGQTKVTFGLYAKICIRNRLVSAIRHRERKKRKEKADSLKEVSVSSEVGSSEGDRCWRRPESCFPIRSRRFCSSILRDCPIRKFQRNWVAP